MVLFLKNILHLAYTDGTFPTNFVGLRRTAKMQNEQKEKQNKKIQLQCEQVVLLCTVLSLYHLYIPISTLVMLFGFISLMCVDQ